MADLVDGIVQGIVLTKSLSHRSTQIIGESTGGEGCCIGLDCRGIQAFLSRIFSHLLLILFILLLEECLLLYASIKFHQCSFGFSQVHIVQSLEYIEIHVLVLFTLVGFCVVIDEK